MISRVSVPPLFGRSAAVSPEDRGSLEEAYTSWRKAVIGSNLTTSFVVDFDTDRMDSVEATILRTNQLPWQSASQAVGVPIRQSRTSARQHARRYTGGNLVSGALATAGQIR